MRNAVKCFLATGLVGLALVIVPVIVLVLFFGGGAPYLDGPNAGFQTKPGFGRWLELNSGWFMIPGLILTIIAIAGLVLIGRTRQLLKWRG